MSSEVLLEFTEEVMSHCFGTARFSEVGVGVKDCSVLSDQIIHCSTYCKAVQLYGLSQIFIDLVGGYKREFY